MIRLAGKDEIKRILGSKGVEERLKTELREVVSGTPYIINNRMLLVLIDREFAVEAHIAQPREFWPHIHEDIAQSLEFIRAIGYNEVYTYVTETLRSTINLVKKHGFKEIKTVEGEVILKWG